MKNQIIVVMLLALTLLASCSNQHETKVESTSSTDSVEMIADSIQTELNSMEVDSIY